MKRKYILLITIVSLIALSIIWYYTLPIQKTQYQARFHIVNGNVAGFDTTTENLFFGIVHPNGQNAKHLFITNLDRKTRVVISTSGEVEDHLSVTDNNFILQPYEEKNITVIASGNGGEPGQYDGVVNIYFYRHSDLFS